MPHEQPEPSLRPENSSEVVLIDDSYRKRILLGTAGGIVRLLGLLWRKVTSQNAGFELNRCLEMKCEVREEIRLATAEVVNEKHGSARLLQDLPSGY